MPRRFAVDDEDTPALSVAVCTDAVGTADADIAVDSGVDDDDDGRPAHQQETEQTPAGLPRCRSPVPRGAVALAVAAAVAPLQAAVAPLQAAVAPAVGPGARS